jgi:hypothetical protein
MARGVASERLRRWYAGQVQPRDDGFLLRPLGRFGGVVLLPDDATVASYVTRRVGLVQRHLAGFCALFGLVLAGMFLMLLDFDAARGVFGSANAFVAVLAAISILATGAVILAHWRLHRWACGIGRRVHATRWRGEPPPDGVPMHLLPGWYVAFTVAVMAVGTPAAMVALALNFPRFFTAGSLQPWLIGALGLGCNWAVATLITLAWRRGNRRSA